VQAHGTSELLDDADVSEGEHGMPETSPYWGIQNLVLDCNSIYSHAFSSVEITATSHIE